MALIAEWANKKLKVSGEMIYNLSDFSSRLQLARSNSKDIEGSPPANPLGRELEEINFAVDLSLSAGVSVRQEINDWRALIGHDAPLYLGGILYGPESVQLVSMDVDDTFIDDLGRMQNARIALNFREYAPEAAGAKAQAEPVTPAPGISLNLSDLGATKSALGIGATASDKEKLSKQGRGGQAAREW